MREGLKGRRATFLDHKECLLNTMVLFLLCFWCRSSFHLSILSSLGLILNPIPELMMLVSLLTREEILSSRLVMNECMSFKSLYFTPLCKVCWKLTVSVMLLFSFVSQGSSRLKEQMVVATNNNCQDKNTCVFLLLWQRMLLLGMEFMMSQKMMMIA